jgi:hypothetical protein
MGRFGTNVRHCTRRLLGIDAVLLYVRRRESVAPHLNALKAGSFLLSSTNSSVFWKESLLPSQTLERGFEVGRGKSVMEKRGSGFSLVHSFFY